VKLRFSESTRRYRCAI